MMHCINDGQTRVYMTTGRVYVERNIFLWIFRLKEEELGNDNARYSVIYRTPEKDNAFAQEARVDIIRPLTKLALLYNCWDKICHAARLYESEIEIKQTKNSPRGVFCLH